MVAVRNSDMDVQVGDVLADKYRVDRVLGRGGMGGWSLPRTPIWTKLSL